jgi:hypothetical protein
MIRSGRLLSKRLGRICRVLEKRINYGVMVG